MAAGAALTAMNRYSFTAHDPESSTTDTSRVNRVFGSSDPLVILVPGGTEDEDYDMQRDLVSKLENLRRADGAPLVSGVTAMVTDGAEALKYYTAPEVAEMTGMPVLLHERIRRKGPRG